MCSLVQTKLLGSFSLCVIPWQTLQGKVKVRYTWICIVPCREDTSKALRYGTRSQAISVLPAHPEFIR